MARDPHIDKLIQDLKAKKFQEGEGKRLTDSFGENLKAQFGPSIDGMGKEVVKAIKESLAGLKMPDMPQVPETKIPDFPQPVVNVPAPIVNIPAPVVHVPAPIVNIPATQFPEYPDFPSEMSLKPGAKPFPVIMSDVAGKPINWGALGGGAAGGRGDFFTIKDIQTSAGNSIIDNDGFVKVTGSFSVSASNASTQLIDSSLNAFGTAANPLNVAITSGAASSTKSQIGNSDGDFTVANPLPITGPVVVTSVTNTIAALNVDSSGVGYSGSNPFPVTLISGTISSTKAQIGNSDGDFSQANPLPVVFSSSGSTASALIDSSGVQYSGSNPLPVSNIGLALDNGDAATALRVVVAGNSAASTSITSITGPIGEGDAASALRVVLANNVAYSTAVTGTVVVSSVTASTQSALIDSSGVQYSGSNPLPVTWVSGAGSTIGAANIDSSGVQYSGSNPFPFSIVTNATATLNVALTDSSGIQYSGSNPVPVVFGASATQAVNLVDSSGVAYSGSNAVPVTGTVVVSSVTATIAAANIDSSGVMYSGSNPFPFTLVTNATSTMNVALTDSGGVQYSGSNPVPMTIVSGALTSTLSVGDSAARAADNGGNPVKVGGIARTTNPTAFADGDRSNFSSDKLGRQLIRPIQVRDLTKTAYATVSTQAETTILTGTSAAFNDLVMITATNASAAAWKVDIRASVGGNIVHTMNVPAGTGPIGFAPPIPYPAADLGATWTATISSGADVSNANLFITGLFSQEI